MAKRLRERIVRDFPQYAELKTLLDLASVTWPRYGIGAAELSELDDYTRELLVIAVTA